MKTPLLSAVLAAALLLCPAVDAADPAPETLELWSHAPLGNAPGKSGLYAADLTGDGRTDLVLGGTRPGRPAALNIYAGTDGGFDVLTRFGERSGTNLRIERIQGYWNASLGKHLLAVAYFDGMVRVYDLQTRALVSERQVAFAPITEIIPHDFGGDGTLELVVLTETRTFILDSLQLQERIVFAFGGRAATLGRFTSMQGVELALGSGQVHAISLQGSIPTLSMSFGNAPAQLMAGNCDEDVLDELVARTSGGMVSAFDITSQATLWTRTVDQGVDALTQFDANGDGRADIVYGEGQWGSLRALDARTGVEVWSMGNPDNGLDRIFAGDFNDDGRPDVAWGSDDFHVHDVGNQNRLWRSERLDGVLRALSSDLDGNGTQEVLATSARTRATSASGALFAYGGQPLSRLWSTYETPLSGVMDEFVDIAAADIEGGPGKEIAIAVSSYSGGVLIFGSGDRSLLRSIPLESGQSAKALAFADVMGSVAPELVVSANSRLFVLDPVSGEVLRASDHYPGGIGTLSLHDSDGNGRAEVWTTAGNTTYRFLPDSNELIGYSTSTVDNLLAVAPPGAAQGQALVARGRNLLLLRNGEYLPVAELCDAQAGWITSLSLITSDRLYFTCSAGYGSADPISGEVAWLVRTTASSTVVSIRPGPDGDPSKVLLNGEVLRYVRAPLSQGISFAALPDRDMSATPFAVSATGGGSGNPVTFQSMTPGTCTSEGNHGATIRMLGIGPCTVRASQEGDATHVAPAPVDRTFTISRGPQTILFATPSSRAFGSGSFRVTPQGGDSGKSVWVLSLTPAVCTTHEEAGHVIRLVSAGTCLLEATQEGNANYFPAPAVQVSFNIAKAGQAIAFVLAGSVDVGASRPLQATGGASGNPVQFASVTPATCTVSGSQVTGSAAGDCTVSANQAGNGNYLAAAQVTQTITVVGTEPPPPPVPEPEGVAGAAGFADRELDGLPALTSARFAGTPMVQPVVNSATVGGDSSPGSPYDSLSDGVAWTPIIIPAAPMASPRDFMVVATARSAAAINLRLFLGEDGDGDGPEASEMRCQRTTAGNAQSCEVRITRQAGAPAATWWALAQNTSAGPGVAVRLAAAAVPFFAENKTLVVSGPGRVHGGAAFTYRYHWDDPTWLAGQERVGYALVYSAPAVLAYYEPIWLRRDGNTAAGHALVDSVPRVVRLAPGEAQDRIYFDVPSNATSVSFRTAGSGEVDLFLARDAAPAGPALAPAPARAAAQHRSQVAGANQAITLTGGQVLPGRWYVTPVNRGTGVGDLAVTATVNARGPAPALRPGHYFNPARSGHGMFIDFAAGQWVMVWYTYLQDGTPTWYFAQAASPVGDNAQWSTSLFRVTWNGSQASATVVGEVGLTILPGPADAAPKLSMNFKVDGESGWEPLTRLGDDSCPAFSGAPLDATGHWYSPSLSGFGYSAQFLPGTEVHAAYVYDDQGFPRWLYGQKNFDAGVVSVPLLQLRGFCPTCAAVPVTVTTVGSLTRVLSTTSNGDGLPGLSHMTVNSNLAAPLSGNWQQSLPVALLSQRKGCQ